MSWVIVFPSTPQLASLGPGGEGGALRTRAAPGLTLRTTPEVTAIFSASSTVLVATVLTLLTTASLTALACSLVFSATVGGLGLAAALTPTPPTFPRALEPLVLPKSGGLPLLVLRALITGRPTLGPEGSEGSGLCTARDPGGE